MVDQRVGRQLFRSRRSVGVDDALGESSAAAAASCASPADAPKPAPAVMSPPIAQHRWSPLLLFAVGCVVQNPAAIAAVPAGPDPRLLAASPATPSPVVSRVVDLQYGGSFCALREDGRVVCWGYNEGSSLGDGTNEARSRPALVPGLDRVQRLLGMPPLGFCALRADASVWCWGFAQGSNSYGPVAGVGPRPVAERVRDFGFAERWPGVCVRRDDGVSCLEFRTEPTDICSYWADAARSSCLRRKLAVVVGQRALADAGRVRFGQSPSAFGVKKACWLEAGVVLCQSPNNFEGRLGNPALERADAPARVPGLADVASLSDSGRSTCAVRADGVAVCWGRNRDGELVVPADTKPCRAFGSERASCNNSPTPLPVRDVVQVLLTPQEMFVLTRAGIVLRSADPRDTARSKSPGLRTVAGLPPAVRLVRGARYPYATCALTGAGEVYCFGQGAHLGDGASLVSRVPLQIPGVHDAVEVHAALTDACALRADGTVTCWGDLEEPRGLRDIVSLGNPCALARDGRVWCWGENSYGEMGLGRRGRPGLAEDIEIAHVPLPVPGLRDVVAISSWLGTTCAVDRGGTVRCWGTWGPTFPTVSPTVIRGIPPATQVWSADGRQCALARGGQVWCWATRAAAASPPDLGVVSELPRHSPGSFQEHQTCVVGLDRRVRCAGGPSLPDLGPVKQISTGRDAEAGIPRGCAVRENGELVCWGPAFCAAGSALCAGWAWNKMETLLDGVKQVSVGGYLACAVRNDGDVWCWGRADGGGLGGESAGAERVSRVDLVHLGR